MIKTKSSEKLQKRLYIKKNITKRCIKKILKFKKTLSDTADA